MPRRQDPRAVTSGSLLVRGNRAHLLKVRKACSDALKLGIASFVGEDEDGDEAVFTVMCSARMIPAPGRETIGFKVRDPESRAE